MWSDQLFAMFDGNSDGKVSLRELIIACSPDINNDGKISGREFELGRKMAVFWLANILSATPAALSDTKINLEELQSIKQDSRAKKPSDSDISKAVLELDKVIQ
jgi:Ca2+-binding EF-hand superfamily protein